MSKVLKFRAVTSGSYRAAEVEELEGAFIAWINDFDGDIIEGTEDASVIENDKAIEPVISDEVRAQVIKEFLETHNIEYQVQLRFRNEEDKPVDHSVFSVDGRMSRK